MSPLQKIKKKRRSLLRVLGSEDGLECLEELEKHFQVHLPVFQGKPGSYDPLDAMRRDAYREVFLYIRHQLELAHNEHSARSEILITEPPNPKM